MPADDVTPARSCLTGIRAPDTVARRDLEFPISGASDWRESVRLVEGMEVADQAREQHGFLDRQSVGGARHDGKLTVRQRTVHRDSMLELNLVIVSEDHERRHGKCREVFHCQRW